MLTSFAIFMACHASLLLVINWSYLKGSLKNNICVVSVIWLEYVLSIIKAKEKICNKLYFQVVEASNDFIPLLLLTADRPPELHDAGANQSINQVLIETY